jgi:hypothetical protein
MTIWFSRKFNGVKKYYSKSILITFRPQHWRRVACWNNRATRKDSCYDFNIHFLGIFFSYTNWDYNR